MDFISTVKGSMLENLYPKGWNMKKIDKCCSNSASSVTKKQPWWNKDFSPIACESVNDFDTMMGHEIALEIKKSRDEKKKIAFILPVGPMGMYRWVVYFLKSWKVKCDHVYCFNMDEWSDAKGNTFDPKNKASFEYSMNEAFYKPLGSLTVPKEQRNFATKTNLPTYAKKIANLKKNGSKLITVFGVGRVCHIAFWEPHFAAEFKSVDEWKKQTHRIAAKLHPLTVEQNSITSFKSRTTLTPCRANTIGPGLFLQSDKIIGGCDGALGRGMQWQGMSFWMTLRYGPDMWIPSTFIPTMPGKLFFLKELAGPLAAKCN